MSKTTNRNTGTCRFFFDSTRANVGGVRRVCVCVIREAFGAGGGGGGGGEAEAALLAVSICASSNLWPRLPSQPFTSVSTKVRTEGKLAAACYQAARGSTSAAPACSCSPVPPTFSTCPASQSHSQVEWKFTVCGHSHEVSGPASGRIYSGCLRRAAARSC